MLVKRVPGRNARNKGNKGFRRRGCYSDWLLFVPSMQLFSQWESMRSTSETEVSNKVSEISQDARVVIPKKNALNIVGN